MANRRPTAEEMRIISVSLKVRSEQLLRAANSEKDPDIQQMRLKQKASVDVLYNDVMNIDLFGSVDK